MTKTKTNPFDSETPEWQLFENWKSKCEIVSSINDDIERHRKRLADVSKSRDLYAEALAKLGYDPDAP